MLCCAVLLVVAVCCVAPLVVLSGWIVRVVACCLVLVRLAVCCAVSLVAVLHCVASLRPARRCAVVRWVVLSRFVWCCHLLCRALGHCPSPSGIVLSGAVFGRVFLCCVSFAVVCRCMLVFAGVLCASVSRHIVFLVLSALCGAVLRCAGALPSCCSFDLSRFWCLVPVCVAVWCAVPFGALWCGIALRCWVRGVLCCCALCALLPRPVELCCSLRRGSPPYGVWLAALLCGAGCCVDLLSLAALPPCAVPLGALLPWSAVLSCPAALFASLPVRVCFLLLFLKKYEKDHCKIR